jgi:hypothetical protein
MIAAMLVFQLVQTQPVVRPIAPVVTRAPAVALPPETDRARLLRESRLLVARAERVEAGYAPKRGQPSKRELDSAIDKAKADLDSLSEMGEMESLRLQMAMDRMSKSMQMLSNVLKKISDTSETITSNLK